jgi:hypothetical protein
MKAWTIKHKGKTWIGNFVGLAHIVSFADGYRCYSGLFFFRKKDAVKYLKSSCAYPELYEVVSLQIEKSDKDNRKNSYNEKQSTTSTTGTGH